MARPQGLPKTGGRQKGVGNKLTADIKALASDHGPKAIETLATLMVSADTDAAKIAAAKEILDRAYGKARQGVEVTGEGGGGLVINIVKPV